MVHNGITENGLAILSSFQTAGKGQQKKSWHSKHDESILLSVIVDAREMAADNIFLLSMSIAAACAQFFRDHTGATAYIKWPNDIYCNDKKAAGILIEPIIRGSVCQYAIVGVGMNINQQKFEEGLDHAVSMFMIREIKQNIIELTKELQNTIMESVNFCFAFPEKVVDLYNTMLYKRNDFALFTIDQKSTAHKVVGVNKKGEIILDNENSFYKYGEATWIIH